MTQGNMIKSDFIDVWLVNLNNTSSLLPYQHLLSHVETTRAKRFRFNADKQRFICRRVALKLILSKYTTQDANRLIIDEADQQKPKLMNAHVHFNTSHSQDVGLVAVSNQPLGVDIEYHKDTLEELNLLAKNVLAETELKHFLESEETVSKRAFYQFWTLKEAYLKAIGLGLSVDPKQIVFDLQALKITSQPESKPQLDWQLHQPELLHEFSMAVVSLSKLNKLNILEFTWP